MPYRKLRSSSLTLDQKIRGVRPGRGGDDQRFVNVTVVGPTGNGGYLTVWPAVVPAAGHTLNHFGPAAINYLTCKDLLTTTSPTTEPVSGRTTM